MLFLIPMTINLLLMSRLHDTTGCQTGLTIDNRNWLYRVYKHSTRFDNRLNEQSVRSTRLSNRLYNRYDNRLYRVNGALVV